MLVLLLTFGGIGEQKFQLSLLQKIKIMKAFARKKR